MKRILELYELSNFNIYYNCKWYFWRFQVSDKQQRTWHQF